ncbi:hypothetical protein F6V30_14370 [Oryzomonas sagensis]|uniref:Uncharacterized protein n=1 Tax=Oryzomonas sagensis TaxID=2603857 RepID=A0ABQ6TLT7_9BACT|nr:hypothetical protein [Oryzomonas sagensis]KAB0669018.1 hypothetical protein F6V30_14370 [Oryzomonas sagensis]
MKNIILFVLLALAVPLAASALDLSVDSSKDKSISRERALSIRKSLEDRHSDTTSHSHDTSNSTTNRRARNINRDTSNTVSIPMIALLPDLGFKPLLPVDLGLAAPIEKGGWITVHVQEYYAKAWASYAPVETVTDPAPVKAYIDLVARKSLIAAQAQLYLMDRLGRLAGKKAVTKNGRKTLDASVLVGINDLPPLAAQAYADAEKNVSAPYLLGIWERYQKEMAGGNCRLSGNHGISCGNIIIELDNPPRLALGNIPLYNGSTFAGVTGDVRVSSSVSLHDAYERSKVVSDADRRSTDDMESNGNAFEAAMSRRETLNKSKGNKINMGVGKFVPGPSH